MKCHILTLTWIGNVTRSPKQYCNIFSKRRICRHESIYQDDQTQPSINEGLQVRW